MPGSSKCYLSRRFPHQNPLCTSPLSYTCYVSRPSHSSQVDHPNNIWWRVQMIKLLFMYSSPLPCYLVPLRPKYLPQHPILGHSQPMFLSKCESLSLTPIQNNRQNYSGVLVSNSHSSLVGVRFRVSALLRQLQRPCFIILVTRCPQVCYACLVTTTT